MHTYLTIPAYTDFLLACMHIHTHRRICVYLSIHIYICGYTCKHVGIEHMRATAGNISTCTLEYRLRYEVMEMTHEASTPQPSRCLSRLCDQADETEEEELSSEG